MSAPAVNRGDGSGREMKQAHSSRKDAALAHELSQSVKPEIDLQSWASLGGNVKPSRTDRKQKRTWKRRAGK